MSLDAAVSLSMIGYSSLMTTQYRVGRSSAEKKLGEHPGGCYSSKMSTIVRYTLLNTSLHEMHPIFFSLYFEVLFLGKQSFSLLNNVAVKSVRSCTLLGSLHHSTKHRAVSTADLAMGETEKPLSLTMASALKETSRSCLK